MRGFTLIEVMIVVVIIAILATIAYPSYVRQIRKSRRAQAKADIVQVAQNLERNFTQTSAYTTAPSATNVYFCSSAFSQPSPSSGTAYYTLTLGNCTATTYTVTATPEGDQTNDVCGTLTMDQTGKRTPDNVTDAGQACW
ncbi:MAG: type IV pilin protein [Rudaea sp.]|uniref:type IV pilin protein n=1 Tax=Rudaea sp. TaxID=2136325 RepID=UPI0039E6750E